MSARQSPTRRRHSPGLPLRLRTQLVYVRRLTPLVGRPALFRSRSVIPGVGLVVKGGSLESRQHRVFGTSQQDSGGVHALVWQLVH